MDDSVPKCKTFTKYINDNEANNMLIFYISICFWNSQAIIYYCSDINSTLYIFIFENKEIVPMWSIHTYFWVFVFCNSQAIIYYCSSIYITLNVNFYTSICIWNSQAIIYYCSDIYNTLYFLLKNIGIISIFEIHHKFDDFFT